MQYICKSKLLSPIHVAHRYMGLMVTTQSWVTYQWYISEENWLPLSQQPVMIYISLSNVGMSWIFNLIILVCCLCRSCAGNFILNIHGSNIPIRSRRQFLNTVLWAPGSLIFFSALSLMCLSLMCRGYVIDDLFGAGHSMVIYALHFGNIWFSVITSI